MINAHYDDTNNAANIVGFYDGAIHVDIPKPNIELTTAQWSDCLDNPGLRRINPDTKQLETYTLPPSSVEDIATAQMTKLSTACRAHITGGIISDALGAPHTYPTDISDEHPDQQNLNGCVTESLLNTPDWTVPFWCADINMVWDRKVHTSVQIQQVGKDVAAHVRTAQDLLKVAFDQIKATAADPALTDDEKRTAITATAW